jgi:Family of unknown function (DUF6062)
VSEPTAKYSSRKRPPSVFAKCDLLEGLSQGRCPVCHATEKATRKYIHSFLYEGMMSPIARQDFLDGGGFCHAHFWQTKTIEQECWDDGFGVAILCENLLEASLKDLENLTPGQAGLRASLVRIRRVKSGRETSRNPGHGCIACKASRGSELHLLSALEGWLGDSDFADRFNQSPGLCLRHIRAAGEQWTSQASLEAVRLSGKKWISHLLKEIREFQRKHDFQYKHEPRGTEWTSPERAIEFLVAPKGKLEALSDLTLNRRRRQ